MIAIWKFEFEVADLVEIEMPAQYRILCVGSQKPRHICIWTMVDTEVTLIKRRFHIRGTGQPIDITFPDVDYIGTAFDGPFVWHVFDGNL